MEEIEKTYVENADQAQALANFLWNELMRHLDDIGDIVEDLNTLERKWNVKPHTVRRFVMP